jgi:hypothetical protein
MRYRAVSILIAVLLLLSVLQCRALGQNKSWWGGFYIGTAGFSRQSGLPDAEYLSFGLFAEPLDFRLFNPALFLGIITAIAPPQSDGLYYQLTGELTVFDLPTAALSKVFFESLCWSPGLAFECLLSRDLRDSAWTLLLSPLRVRAGDGVFTVCALQLFIEPPFAFGGWGIVLFRTALFIW